MASVAEAQSLMEQAAKKAASRPFFGGTRHLDEASDLYSKAANAFKLAKKWKESGDAFAAQGLVLEKLGEKDEASSAYLNASKSYKKESPADAADNLKKAINFLTEKGRFSAAASNQKQLAEIYENDLMDIEKAMEAYELAADWYLSEDSNAQASGCLLKVAEFAATREQYDRAIEVYERVASKALENQLTKWSVREYFLKAGICVLCTTDYVRARKSLEKYQNLDATFSSTRECQLLSGLCDAVDAGDVEAFTAKLQEYDRLTKLDEWKTTLLLRVKKALEAGEEDFTCWP